MGTIRPTFFFGTNARIQSISLDWNETYDAKHYNNFLLIHSGKKRSIFAPPINNEDDGAMVLLQGRITRNDSVSDVEVTCKEH